jgi:hypothetical protein
MGVVGWSGIFRWLKISAELGILNDWTAVAGVRWLAKSGWATEAQGGVFFCGLIMPD